MIPVKRAAEPGDFDRKVRQKGHNAVAELTGKKAPPRSGSKRKVIARLPAKIPANALPDYWTAALDDLAERYQRRCAYTSIHLDHGTSVPTVDHWIPKSIDWQQAYEWNNYRLCCHLANTLKSTHAGLLDPFEIKEGWFALELTAFQVTVGLRAPRAKRREIERTISSEGLYLNCPDFCRNRECSAVAYWKSDVSLQHLEERAPFVASELRRQGRLRKGDK
jgi:hypothetical protein